MEAAAECVWWVVVVVVVGGLWGGVQSHLLVQPNYNVDVVLSYVVFGLVTIQIRQVNIKWGGGGIA